MLLRSSEIKPSCIDLYPQITQTAMWCLTPSSCLTPPHPKIPNPMRTISAALFSFPQKKTASPHVMPQPMAPKTLMEKLSLLHPLDQHTLHQFTSRKTQFHHILFLLLTENTGEAPTSMQLQGTAHRGSHTPPPPHGARRRLTCQMSVYRNVSWLLNFGYRPLPK